MSRQFVFFLSMILHEWNTSNFSITMLISQVFTIWTYREVSKKLARIAKATLHNLPGKSNLNVSFVFPVCPVHDMNKRKDNSISSTLFSIALLQNELTGQTISKFPFLIWESWSVMKSILVCGRFTFSWTRCSCLCWIRL